MAAAFRLPSKRLQLSKMSRRHPQAVVGAWLKATQEGRLFGVLHDAVLRQLKASDTEQFATRLKSSLGGEEMSCMVLAPPYPMASSVAAIPAKSISLGPIGA
jgi:hypothetical protein